MPPNLAVGGDTMVNFFGDSVAADKLVTGVVVVAVLGFIIFGGVKRIAHVTQVIVPFMALGYILMAVGIIIYHIAELPAIIALIFSDIFNPMAGLGAAIGWGVKRGIYSNEAGQGSGPHAAAASEVQHPAQQGLVQSFSVYVDTLFVCSATAFMILITQQYYVTGLDASISGGVLGPRSSSAALRLHSTRSKASWVASARRSSPLHCSSSRSRLCSLTTTLRKPTSRIYGGRLQTPGLLKPPQDRDTGVGVLRHDS